MASTSSLPSEIWSDHILPKVNSLDGLGRCRMVSKEWNHSTYESRFWELIANSSGNLVSGFLIQRLTSLKGVENFTAFVSADYKANKTLQLSTVLNFLPSPVKIEAVSSQGGLVFCVNNNYKAPKFFVCKPTTQQWEKLPNPKTNYYTKGTAIVVLSSKPFRYKIIRFSIPNSTYPYMGHKSKLWYTLRCELFDSKIWAWKRLEDVRLPDFEGMGRPVTSCGVCYWRLTGKQVFAFHYQDGKESWEIFDLPMPVIDHGNFSLEKQLTVYEGHLALICVEGEFMDLWVMENHDKKAWSKRHKMISVNVLRELEGFNIPSPLAFNNSDIAVMKGYLKVFFYKFCDSSCNVVRLEDQPDQIFKLESDYEKVNLRSPVGTRSEHGLIGSSSSCS